MQVIKRPWGMTVLGEAKVEAEPDLARIRFRVARLEPAPSDAFGSAGAAVSAVRQALRDHGIADSAVRDSRLSLQSSWEYGEQRRFLGYECAATFAVESADLDDLPRLVEDIVAAGANEIYGVEFDVRERIDARARACREAVADARRKAELYAAAAGVRVGPVLHIEDGTGPTSIELARNSAASREDLAPGRVTISASVVVGFAIVQD